MTVLGNLGNSGLVDAQALECGQLQSHTIGCVHPAQDLLAILTEVEARRKQNTTLCVRQFKLQKWA